jgi:hypothetical protein
MWLFTKHGFYSVVCARQGDGRHGQPVDEARLMVRARVRGHLEALRQQFPELLGEAQIRTFEGTDYAYRLFVPKAVWTTVAAALAEELDYDNFKDEVGRVQGRAGTDYERALHDVWEVMYGLQERG